MKSIVAHDFLVLQPGQLISVSADVALTMQLNCGRVWVTIEGDKNDYWPLNGDILALSAGRHVVIEAYKMFSRVDFLPTPQPVERPAMQVIPSDDDHLAAADLAVE